MQSLANSRIGYFLVSLKIFKTEGGVSEHRNLFNDRNNTQLSNLYTNSRVNAHNKIEQKFHEFFFQLKNSSKTA